MPELDPACRPHCVWRWYCSTECCSGSGRVTSRWRFGPAKGSVHDIQRNRRHIAQAGEDPGRAAPKRHRAGRAVQSLARACQPGGAVVVVDFRSDAQRRRADGPRARAARVLRRCCTTSARTSYPRHHKHSGPPHQERRFARFRALRSRNDCPHRALSSQIRAEEVAQRLHRNQGENGTPCARWPRSSGWPKCLIAATRRRSRASKMTGATNTSLSSAQPATPSSSSGPPIVR